MSAAQELTDYAMPPREIAGPSVWYGPDVAAREDEWIRPFGEEELAELEAALQGVKSRGLGILDIDSYAFPLPRLSPVFDGIRREVLRGRGFVLLRGIPVERYSIEEAAIIYFGIGSHFGIPLPQNAKGHVLGHVKDLGRHEFDTKSRIYQTTARQTFHSDTADIVGLMCLHPARKGGESAVVSSDTLYNEVRRRRPDLLPLLFQPYATDWRNEAPEGRITILVSHRFSTVRMADTIVVMDGARAVEVGTHEELMARGGQYAELYGIQASAYRSERPG